MDIKIIIKNAIFFLILVLIQVVLLSNINVSILDISPQFYILFILLLPFEIAGWIILLIAFLLGLSIDIFLDTIAVHTSATLFATFSRPTIIRLLAPRNGYEFGALPGIQDLGLTWFLKYSTMMVIIHHVSYFIIDIFSFIDFHLSLLKIIITIIFSTSLIVFSQFLVFKNTK